MNETLQLAKCFQANTTKKHFDTIALMKKIGL